MNKDKMPLSEIRRILERGEWWDNVRDVSPDEPRPWLDELNGAIDAALDELQAYHDAEAEGRLVRLPCKIGERVYEIVKTYSKSQPNYCFNLCSGMIDGHKVKEPCAHGNQFPGITLSRFAGSSRESNMI